MKNLTPKRIRRLRKSGLRLTQKQLATALGVSVSAVKMWEQGHRQPSPAHRDQLGRWADALEPAGDDK